jgi:hypothetical protein
VNSERDATRRGFVRLSGALTLTGLAGCAGGDGGDETPTAGGGLGPVPGEYETATSIGGVERQPDGLATKDAVRYQSTPNGGQQCSNCTYYVEDMNDDGLGACSIVEGKIGPEAWCASYVPYRE